MWRLSVPKTQSEAGFLDTYPPQRISARGLPSEVLQTFHYVLYTTVSAI